MLLRTFLRTLFDFLIEKNVIINTFVNFYYKSVKITPHILKLKPEKPIANIERKNNIFFQSVTGDSIDCK